MINIGMIGCGKIAEKHLSGYCQLDNVSISVSDLDINKKTTANKFGVEWVDDPISLIESDKFDAIDICTPTSTHLELITHALKKGKHVIAEKPLVIKPQDAITIKQLSEQSNSKIFVAYPFRFSPAFKKVAELLEHNVIGDPYFAMVRLGGRGSHQVWKHNKESDGGAINEMLVHALDLILWFFKEIEMSEKLVNDTILKSRTIQGKEYQVNAEDLILLKLLTKQGVEIICQSDLITPSYMNYIEIHGSNGSIFTSIMDRFPTTVFCHEPRDGFAAGTTTLNFNQVNLFHEELAYFINCIVNNKEPENNGIDESIAIAELIQNTF